jgi:enoyl-[acyl-carrier protein] reductase I
VHHEGGLAGGRVMAGKRGLIMGLANDKSIAWGIAKACADAGAEIAFSYQGEALKKRVDPLAEQLGVAIVLPCDVGDEASIDALFAALGGMGQARFRRPRHRLFRQERAARPLRRHQPRQFPMTMDISVYSFTAVAAAPKR